MTGGRRGGAGGRANKPGSHRKGADIGSGGKNRRSLRGKGPTPPARLRPGHPAAKRADAPRAGGARGAPQSNTPGSSAGAAPGRAHPARAGGEVVLGRNPVVEALRARMPAVALYVGEGVTGDARVREALDLAARATVPVLPVPRRELDRLAGGAPHQGIALVVPAYSYLHPDDLLARAAAGADPPLLVAVDGITDPRNLGAIVRCVAAFGGHGVLVPERRAAGMTAAAWKASAGTAAYLPVARATNLVRALGAWRDAGLVVVGLAVDGGLPVDAVDPGSDPLVLVVGSEGRGLSRLVRDTCDQIVRIPMAGRAESLNASVAAAVALYEVARRRAG